MIVKLNKRPLELDQDLRLFPSRLGIIYSSIGDGVNATKDFGVICKIWNSRVGHSMW